MAWNDKRPMSPHLQVYKLPLTAVLSVLHRGTGAALGFGSILLVLTLMSAAAGADSYATMHGILSSFLGQLVLFGFTGALYYHFCNGIRHLWWDMGKGLELEDAAESGKMVIGGAVALTLITWIVSF